ncbi:MAG: hypothetical protein M0Q53_05130 [Prolixibacteraceae bacterium]|jgi:hypothetical protein|nr:hypothetical protein [Prolixibacteraceae bacterium]
MKKSNLKLFLAFLVVAIAGIIVYSCRKSEGPPDPNANITVERKLVISALNSFARDSIGQFSVAITSPSGTGNQVATGNTYVVKDPVAGDYTIIVSKTGYNTASPEVITVTLPSDPKVSMTINVTSLLVKLATPVAVTGTTGAVIAVKTNSEVPTSAPVANATVAPGTVFTLADGTKPATVNMTVTNIPTEASTAPVSNTGGGQQATITSNPELVNSSVPLQQLDLQPSGLVLSVPMMIDMYIGDDYPSDMTLAEKIATQDGLTLNYVRSDGTVEVVSPDHFSADRNTVYYKISHFSRWTRLNKYARVAKANPFITYETQSKTSDCGGFISGSFIFSRTYLSSTRIGWWLGLRSNLHLYYGFIYPIGIIRSPTGYYVQGDATVAIENWVVSVTTPGFGRTYSVQIPTNITFKQAFIPCHNQGGHNQGG